MIAFRFSGDHSQEYSGALTKYPWQHSSHGGDAFSRGPKCPLHAAFNKELPTNISSSLPLLRSSERCDIQRESAGQGGFTDAATVASVAYCDTNDPPGDTDCKNNSGNIGLTQRVASLEVPSASSEFEGCGLQECHVNPRLVTQFVEILTAAVRKRVFNLPRERGTETCHHEDCKKTENCSCQCCERPPHRKGSKVGILFSGGLDSMVLAALADR